MTLIKELKENFAFYKERDPAVRTYWDVLLYPCFRVMRAYRKAHKLWESGKYFRARCISARAARKTGIEIHPGAQIGENFFIDHGTGVVIGETAVIGNNVTLYQGVTLGGNGKEKGKRHPTLKDGVMVSAGAKLLGSFTVGENSKIGAGSVVLHEVPPNCTVVGVPGRVVRMKNQTVPYETMDHSHLPDPILSDMKVLQKANNEVINRLLSLEEEVKRMERRAEGHADQAIEPVRPIVVEPEADRDFVEVDDAVFADYI